MVKSKILAYKFAYMRIGKILKAVKFFEHGQKYFELRAVARSENPKGLVVLGGDNVSPLVEKGLTDLRRPCIHTSRDKLVSSTHKPTCFFML